MCSAHFAAKRAKAHTTSLRARHVMSHHVIRLGKAQEVTNPCGTSPGATTLHTASGCPTVSKGLRRIVNGFQAVPRINIHRVRDPPWLAPAMANFSANFANFSLIPRISLISLGFRSDFANFARISLGFCTDFARISLGFR